MANNKAEDVEVGDIIKTEIYPDSGLIEEFSDKEFEVLAITANIVVDASPVDLNSSFSGIVVDTKKKCDNFGIDHSHIGKRVARIHSRSVDHIVQKAGSKSQKCGIAHNNNDDADSKLSEVEQEKKRLGEWLTSIEKVRNHKPGNSGFNMI
jgi:hypothetical protein